MRDSFVVLDDARRTILPIRSDLADLELHRFVRRCVSSQTTSNARETNRIVICPSCVQKGMQSLAVRAQDDSERLTRLANLVASQLDDDEESRDDDGDAAEQKRRLQIERYAESRRERRRLKEERRRMRAELDDLRRRSTQIDASEDGSVVRCVVNDHRQDAEKETQILERLARTNVWDACFHVSLVADPADDSPTPRINNARIGVPMHSSGDGWNAEANVAFGHLVALLATLGRRANLHFSNRLSCRGRRSYLVTPRNVRVPFYFTDSGFFDSDLDSKRVDAFNRGMDAFVENVIDVSAVLCRSSNGKKLDLHSKLHSLRLVSSSESSSASSSASSTLGLSNALRFWEANAPNAPGLPWTLPPSATHQREGRSNRVVEAVVARSHRLHLRRSTYLSGEWKRAMVLLCANLKWLVVVASIDADKHDDETIEWERLDE